MEQMDDRSVFRKGYSWMSGSSALSEAIIVKPEQNVMFTWKLEAFVRMDVKYQAGDSPEDLAEDAWELRCDGSMIAPSDCNMIDQKMEVLE